MPTEKVIPPPLNSTDYRAWGLWGIQGWSAYTAEVEKRDVTADCLDEHKAAGDLR